MGRTVTVVGTGLIGGSVGLGIRAVEPTARVVGFDSDPRALAAALKRGAITDRSESVAAGVDGADLVVLAAPVDAIPDACRDVAEALRPGTVVTDVGSAKTALVRGAEAVLGGSFVGGHPMAGSERRGVEAADAGLFDGAPWILTPTTVTSSGSYATVSQFVTRLGARPVALSPEVHDALVARLSHVPQLTASALVHVALSAADRDELLGLAASGFRDTTRIAASSPDIWVAILRSNRSAVLEALDGLSGGLAAVRGMIAGRQWNELAAWLDRSRSARLHLFSKPEYGGAPIGLSMMVPDHPGVLAEVTTQAGRIGVNIEDLRIVHSTEGGRGRLELIVAGDRAADALSRALSGLGYRVEQVDIQ
jgi:prephenate dehydrogenase